MSVVLKSEKLGMLRERMLDALSRGRFGRGDVCVCVLRLSLCRCINTKTNVHMVLSKVVARLIWIT